jgi:hypothetical protein
VLEAVENLASDGGDFDVGEIDEFLYIFIYIHT